MRGQTVIRCNRKWMSDFTASLNIGLTGAGRYCSIALAANLRQADAQILRHCIHPALPLQQGNLLEEAQTH